MEIFHANENIFALAKLFRLPLQRSFQLVEREKMSFAS